MSLLDHIASVAGENRTNERITRKEFVAELEQLLKYTRLDIARLEYVPGTVQMDIEHVVVHFATGSTKRACIECDSYAAIIKDVLAACM